MVNSIMAETQVAKPSGRFMKADLVGSEQVRRHPHLNGPNLMGVPADYLAGTPQQRHGANADRQAMRPAYKDRPGGLRTGSPSFPPPRLIRPTVRLLPRSPRFRVRVPISLLVAEQFPDSQAATTSIADSF
jgi:hypothetical protein